MFTHLLAKIFGSANDRALQKLQLIVDKINTFEPFIEKLSELFYF